MPVNTMQHWIDWNNYAETLIFSSSVIFWFYGVSPGTTGKIRFSSLLSLKWSNPLSTICTLIDLEISSAPYTVTCTDYKKTPGGLMIKRHGHNIRERGDIYCRCLWLSGNGVFPRSTRVQNDHLHVHKYKLRCQYYCLIFLYWIDVFLNCFY